MADVNDSAPTHSTPTDLNNLSDVTIAALPTGPRVLWFNTGTSQWGPLTPAAAVTTPNVQTGAYVQADVTTLKTAIDAIRAALTAAGITL